MMLDCLLHNEGKSLTKRQAGKYKEAQKHCSQVYLAVIELRVAHL